MSDGEIASRLSLSYSHVKSLRRQSGLAARGDCVIANVERGQRTRAEIARLHAAGRDATVIAAALGLTLAYVRDRLRRDGLEAAAEPVGAKPRFRLSRAERGAHTHAEVARLQRQGLSGKQIAERLGFSVDYVREIVAKLGRPEPVLAVREEAVVEEGEGEMPRWWRNAKRACAEHLDDLRGVFGLDGGYPFLNVPGSSEDRVFASYAARRC